MNLDDWSHYFYLFPAVDVNNATEITASKPVSQPNINHGQQKLGAEEFLPVESYNGKRRSHPLSPSRSKTPIDSTRAQTMSQYESLEASDHI